MTLDLPGRHASRVHGDDLLVEARKPPLIPGDQLRVERAFPIARNTQVQLGILGQHRLLRIAIAVIGLARRRMAVEMIIQFRVQDALGQRFLQLVKKPILGKHLLRIAPRQKLVQRALLDRHSPPPAASLWPHTQDPDSPALIEKRDVDRPHAWPTRRPLLAYRNVMDAHKTENGGRLLPLYEFATR